MSLVGYARVSTTEGRQVLDRQLDALNAAGCERVFDDRASGAATDRPNLAACLDYSGQSDPFTHDGGNRKQKHCTRTRPPPGSPRTRSQIPPARPQAPRHPRSGVSPIPSRVLRARLLLAPTCRVPVRDHANHPRGVLACQIPCQRGTGPTQPTRPVRSRLASRDRLGMSIAQAAPPRNRPEAGPVAARK